MNTSTMNKLQLCGAGSSRPEARIESLPAGRPVAAPRPMVKVEIRKAAAVVLGAAVLAVAAASWLVASRAMPLQVVDLPRVVIQAERLAPGSCPVPVDPIGADCPVPTQAMAADVATDGSLSRSTQP